MNVMCSCLVFLLVSSFCMVFIPLPDISDVCVEVTLQNLTKNSTNSTATNRVFELVHKGSDIGHFVDMVGFSFVAFCMQFATVTCDSIHTAVTLQSLGDANSGKIGNIRAWGSLGHGIGAIAIGSLVSTSTVSQLICGKMVQGTDYHYMFYLTAFFGAVTLANIPRIFKCILDNNSGVSQLAFGEYRRIALYNWRFRSDNYNSRVFHVFHHSNAHKGVRTLEVGQCRNGDICSSISGLCSSGQSHVRSIDPNCRRRDVCLSVECHRISPQQSGTRTFPDTGPRGYAGSYRPWDGYKFPCQRSLNSGFWNTENVSDFRGDGFDIPCNFYNCSDCSG
ncbi:uncharacterized protein LOC135480772 isoform X2 [Liolophura sinensis]|uniref:uncharacterized protein LOC135480772 isoform X2 n=1 Tax=Liolophura sinensis TaxID=3198878 RepID=UPI003159206D